MTRIKEKKFNIVFKKSHQAENVLDSFLPLLRVEYKQLHGSTSHEVLQTYTHKRRQKHKHIPAGLD